MSKTTIHKGKTTVTIELDEDEARKLFRVLKTESVLYSVYDSLRNV